jgi:hypothetical protein
MVKFTRNEKIVSQENPMMRVVVILVGLLRKEKTELKRHDSKRGKRKCDQESKTVLPQYLISESFNISGFDE